ncbi:MAG: hypothetical protein AAF580_13420, partial [Pseudomonadota bacterium]
DQLGIPKVLIPPLPGAFSAFGGLCAQLFEERQETVLLTLNEDGRAQLADLAARFETDLHDTLSADGFASSRIELRTEVDARYLGQSHELTVTVADLATISGIRTPFEVEFQRQFGRLDNDRTVQIVNLRVIASVRAAPPKFTAMMTGAPSDTAPSRADAPDARHGDLPIHIRSALATGAAIDGPAIIQELTATTYLPVGWTLRVGAAGELVLTTAQAAHDAKYVAGHRQHDALAASTLF